MPLLDAHFGGLFSFMEFTKNVISIDNQIIILRERGLNIANLDKVRVVLSNVSYYRLSGYMQLFQENSLPNRFRKGTSFDHVYNMYNFDRELKLIIFGALERLEIAIKNQFTLKLATVFGNNWFENPLLFDDRNFYNLLQAHLLSEFKKSEEGFIVHYKNTYDKPLLPPSWMIFEMLSFGNISKIYSHLNSPNERRDISGYFKTHDNIFHSWLHTLVYLRNLCAHHSRLISRKLFVTPIIPTRKKNRILHAEIDNNSLYAYLCIIGYLLRSIQSEDDFTKKIIRLCEVYPGIGINRFGFTPDWKNEALWKL